MALDWYDKAKLDRAFAELIDGLVGDTSYTLNELATLVNAKLAEGNGYRLEITGRSIPSSWERLYMPQYSMVCVSTKPNKYRFAKKGHTVVAVERYRDKILFKTEEDRENEECTITKVYYDLTNGKLVYNGVEPGELFSRLSSSLESDFRNLNHPKEWVLNYIGEIPSYSTLINALRASSEMPDACPKGYATWLADNGERPNTASLERFTFFTKYGDMGLNYRAVYGTNITTFIFEVMGLKKFTKICSNTLVKKGYVDRYEVNNFMELYRKLYNSSLKDEIVIDVNRDISYNYNLLDALKNKEANEKLASRLQYLNPINGMKVGEYTVVVPQNLFDLQNEGRQQNNCVGYYYNNHVLQGYNLLYFLRKTDKIEKSYITCRFDVNARYTCEHRYVNNEQASSTELQTIYDTVDAEIIKLLNASYITKSNDRGSWTRTY